MRSNGRKQGGGGGAEGKVGLGMQRARGWFFGFVASTCGLGGGALVVVVVGGGAAPPPPSLPKLC